MRAVYGPPVLCLPDLFCPHAGSPCPGNRRCSPSSFCPSLREGFFSSALREAGVGDDGAGCTALIGHRCDAPFIFCAAIGRERYENGGGALDRSIDVSVGFAHSRDVTPSVEEFLCYIAMDLHWATPFPPAVIVRVHYLPFNPSPQPSLHKSRWASQYGGEKESKNKAPLTNPSAKMVRCKGSAFGPCRGFGSWRGGNTPPSSGSSPLAPSSSPTAFSFRRKGRGAFSLVFLFRPQYIGRPIPLRGAGLRVREPAE